MGILPLGLGVGFPKKLPVGEMKNRRRGGAFPLLVQISPKSPEGTAYNSDGRKSFAKSFF